VIHLLKIYLSPYKIYLSHVNQCKFFIHLRNFNVRYFGMVEATRLKSMASRSLQWHDLSTEIHRNLPNGSKLSQGTHKMVISWTSIYFFKEIWLKWEISNRLTTAFTETDSYLQLHKYRPSFLHHIQGGQVFKPGLRTLLCWMRLCRNFLSTPRQMSG
jgi:hypothetical protein